MTTFKLLLVALIACSVLFIAWLLLGSYFWVKDAHGIAIICFLISFICVLGQFAVLALTLREHSKQRKSTLSTHRSSS